MSSGSPTPRLESPAPVDRLATLPPWPWDPFDRAAPMTLGWEVARWAEALLVQPNGPRAGRPFRFTSDQLRFLLWWYALDDDAQWLFFHAVRRLAKGSGKSPFAAVLALIEFVCPVARLARKDDRAPGGCIGRAVDMPLVQIAATSQAQTANTMRYVRALANKRSAIVREYGLDVGKTQFYRQPEGTLEAITSSPTSAEGAESTFVIGDETEHWTPTNGGDDLAATLEDNLAKSGARMVETANAWVPGTASVAEGTWDAWVAQEEGRLVDGAGRILYDARLAPAGVDLADPVALVAALEFVYGDADWKRPHDEAGNAVGPVDVTPILRKIWSPKSKPSESRRKYLNWPAVAETAWVAPEDWAANRRPRPVDLDEPIALFFDGSKSRDATALVACAIDDGYVFVPTWAGGRTVWEPDPSHDTGDVVPVVEVDAAVRQVAEVYNVAGFFADVAEWESFVKVEWPKAFEDLVVDAVPAGGKDPQRIAWDMRSHAFDFTRAAELAEAEIVAGARGEGDGIPHDGDPVLARHVANTRRRPNRWGISVGKESPSSALKIDAAVCMIGARMARRAVLAADAKAGRKRKRTGVVW
jgi:hypothetical protein